MTEFQYNLFGAPEGLGVSPTSSGETETTTGHYHPGTPCGLPGDPFGTVQAETGPLDPGIRFPLKLRQPAPKSKFRTIRVYASSARRLRVLAAQQDCTLAEAFDSVLDVHAASPAQAGYATA